MTHETLFVAGLMFVAVMVIILNRLERRKRRKRSDGKALKEACRKYEEQT